MKPGYAQNAYSIVRKSYPHLTEEEFTRVWESALYMFDVERSINGGNNERH